MKKYLFFIFLLFFIHPVLAETIQLPYTDNTNVSVITEYPLFDNTTYIYITGNDNEIYSIESMYYFSTDKLHVDNGVYINNLSFTYGINNYTITEIYTIENGFLFFKDVTRELIVYEDSIETNRINKEFSTFYTAPNFAYSKYTFLTNKIIYENRYSSLKGYISYKATLDLQYNLVLTKLEQSGNLSRSVTITYIKIGDKPKSYYIGNLNPIFKLPYKLIERFDGDNNILNVLLIVTFFLKALFFWITVIYHSFFIIQFLILAVLIPVFSVSKSKNPKQFIELIIDNYARYFRILIKIFRYIIDLIIKLIELIPFI